MTKWWSFQSYLGLPDVLSVFGQLLSFPTSGFDQAKLLASIGQNLSWGFDSGIFSLQFSACLASSIRQLSDGFNSGIFSLQDLEISSGFIVKFYCPGFQRNNHRPNFRGSSQSADNDEQLPMGPAGSIFAEPEYGRSEARQEQAELSSNSEMEHEHETAVLDDGDTKTSEREEETQNGNTHGGDKTLGSNNTDASEEDEDTSDDKAHVAEYTSDDGGNTTLGSYSTEEDDRLDNRERLNNNQDKHDQASQGKQDKIGNTPLDRTESKSSGSDSIDGWGDEEDKLDSKTDIGDESDGNLEMPVNTEDDLAGNIDMADNTEDKLAGDIEMEELALNLVPLQPVPTHLMMNYESLLFWLSWESAEKRTTMDLKALLNREKL
ncbi:hypothetical protein KEM48_009222 [Puccinia striiformis f. sp. tritici PST-130]|nr:hypothetical protein KEM48_009222 [Puccinia striiformis f. sp. tritici PST-130]